MVDCNSSLSFVWARHLGVTPGCSFSSHRSLRKSWWLHLLNIASSSLDLLPDPSLAAGSYVVSYFFLLPLYSKHGSLRDPIQMRFFFLCLEPSCGSHFTLPNSQSRGISTRPCAPSPVFSGFTQVSPHPLCPATLAPRCSFTFVWITRP